MVICVIFTVINLCGYSYFLGLTIELVTSICMVLSPGFALDYAAHIGVIFTSYKDGTRQQKMQFTME